MTGPVRIQLKRTKGWRMPPNTVKVDRTSKWGNPYTPSETMPVAVCVSEFRRMAKGSGYYDLRELRGKNLACWCKPGAPCHADVLLELANQPHSLRVSVSPDAANAGRRTCATPERRPATVSGGA